MPDSSPPADRRRHARREDRAEMHLGPSRSAVSNLSTNGAFVSVLSGLRADDTFSFELALDDRRDWSVRGRAVVIWVDPGVGAGVRFELNDEEEQSLARYLDELQSPEDGTESATVDPAQYDTPRRSRRTVAVGPAKGGRDSKVWFRYLPDDETR